jgi:hypothetical protein
VAYQLHAKKLFFVADENTIRRLRIFNQWQTRLALGFWRTLRGDKSGFPLVVYLLAGFLCFCWLKHEEDEEEPTTVQKHSRAGLQHSGAVIFLPVFGQPVATRRRKRLEGILAVLGEIRGGGPVWILSLAAQFVYWSRIVSGLHQEHA